jgi:hypothetical protein
MFVAGTQFATKHWAVPIENAPKHVENVQCGAYYVCIKTGRKKLIFMFISKWTKIYGLWVRMRTDSFVEKV